MFRMQVMVAIRKVFALQVVIAVGNAGTLTGGRAGGSSFDVLTEVFVKFRNEGMTAFDIRAPGHFRVWGQEASVL